MLLIPVLIGQPMDRGLSRPAALVVAGLLLQGLVLARDRPDLEEPAPIL